MNTDKTRRRNLEHLAARIAGHAMALAVVDARGNTVLDRIRQSEPGVKAVSYDGARRSGGISDPVGREASAAADPDTAVTRPFGMRDLDRLIDRMMRDEDRLAKIIAANPPPRRRTKADELALARENRPARPGCESCARIKSASDPRDPYWNEVDPRTPTVAEALVPDPSHPSRKLRVPRLEDPMGLCTWCYRFLLQWWRLPSEKELAARRDDPRGRVMMPADEQSRVPARVSARIAVHLEQLARAAEDSDGHENGAVAS